MPISHIHVSDEDFNFVKSMVESGRYDDVSDAYRSGLRLLKAHEEDYGEKSKALEAAVQVGIDDIEAGRFVTIESPEELEESSNRSLKIALQRLKSRSSD